MGEEIVDDDVEDALWAKLGDEEGNCPDDDGCGGGGCGVLDPLSLSPSGSAVCWESVDGVLVALAAPT